MRYKVIYLAQDNSEKLTREFEDFNAAINFYAECGPERATFWEAAPEEKCTSEC